MKNKKITAEEQDKRYVYEVDKGALHIYNTCFRTTVINRRYK